MRFIIILLFIFSLTQIFSRKESVANVPSQNIKKENITYCAPSFDPASLTEGKAPLIEGLGNIHFTVTTSSEKAQQYFNQGLALLYAFNHNEAGRSFMAAIEHDSTLAMAYWGLGMVLGPNYNAALNASSLIQINEAMDKARLYAGNASVKEKALIHALSKRFPKKATNDMTPYNTAYSVAMKEAYEQFPGDSEIAVLFADALMNEHPWSHWLKDGTPQPWTPNIIATLESMLHKWPDHPSVIHLYVHATEASKNAEKALPYADKLPKLMPAAGHIVHMPSHTYIRTGDYHKGVMVNEMASRGDSTYVAQCKVQGFYAMMLYPHNIHFLAACAFLEGNSKKALDAAWAVSNKADRRYLHENITLQHYYSIPYYVMVQLAKWNDILQLEQPAEDMKYPVAVWHYARGMAFSAKGQKMGAAKELASINEIQKDESLKSMLIWENNSAAQLVQIAADILSAEIAAADNNYEEAIQQLRNAVDLEDALTYQEPPDWFFSVRHTLGYMLVQAGQFAEAEKVYREDLEKYKENGWALIGLYNSLKAQGKNVEAFAAKQRFDKAWKWADIELTSSRLY